MKLTFAALILLLTASFAYNEFSDKPQSFEITKVQDHHWNTDYAAFRSYNANPDHSAYYTMSSVPVEDLNIEKDFIIEKLQILSGEKPFLLNGVQTIIPQRGNDSGKVRLQINM